MLRLFRVCLVRVERARELTLLENVRSAELCLQKVGVLTFICRDVDIGRDVYVCTGVDF